MFNRSLTSSVLAAVVLTMSFGCNRDNSTAGTNTTTGPAQNAGRAVDTAARNTADAARDTANRTADAANNAANNVTNQGASAGSATQTANNPKLPGMPSVQGTNTNNMSTADAAAQRLIDNARNNLKQNDTGKAKTLLAELKDKGMYDSLSAQQKANVDQLEKDINAATPTAQNR